MTYSSENKVDGIVLVTDDAKEYLNPRQEVTYREHRRELAEWMLALGKNPEKAEGYSHSTAKNRMNRLDLFYRFVWNRKGRFVQDLTIDDADDWMRHLATEEMKESTKNHYQKAAKTLFKWKREARNKDVGWEPEIQYSDIDLQVIISGDLSKSRRELHEVRQEIEEQEFKGERYELQLLVESVESAESYGEDLKEIFSEGIKLKETEELEQVTEAVFRG